jgi:hypothetical protein
VLRADAFRQGRRPGRALAADLAGLGDRPRHQGRELAADRRLPRAHGRVLLFDPTNPKSPPTIRCSRSAAANGKCDVQNIADILVDPEGSLEKRNHWEKTSHALLVGAILHVLYAEGTRRWPASPPSSPIRSGRSSRRSPR